jgi:carbon-monoxide dehydrogenase medium subunit
MIPRSFEYFAPRTLEEAVSLLGELGQEAKILSGGQSLIPMMKLRLATPPYIIDINRLPDLNYISELNGFLRIGALARESAFEVSPTIQSRYPILMDTTVVIADPLVRNQATACGNLAHGDPANDHPATMLALGASIIAIGPSGKSPSRAFSPASSRLPFSLTKYSRRSRFRFRRPLAGAHI